MRTHLLSIIIACQAISLASIQYARAQVVEYQVDLQTEEDWAKRVTGNSTWNGSGYTVKDQDFIEIKLTGPADYIEGEYSNGVTGCGMKEFSIWGVYDRIANFSPGTSAIGQYNYFRHYIDPDIRTGTIRIKYRKTNNMSEGRIRNLRINKARTSKETRITPCKFRVSSCQPESVMLLWSNAIGTGGKEGIYNIRLYMYNGLVNKHFRDIEVVNERSVLVEHLSPYMKYKAELTRTFDGNVSDTVTIRFDTSAKSIQYLVEIDSEEAFSSSWISKSDKAHWAGKNIEFPAGATMTINLKNTDTNRYLEGDFNNGVWGAGDRHFLIEACNPETDSYDTLEEYNPGTSNNSSYVYHRIPLVDWATEVRITFKRGANASVGRIKNLNIIKMQPDAKSVESLSVKETAQGADLMWNYQGEPAKSAGDLRLEVGGKTLKAFCSLYAADKPEESEAAGEEILTRVKEGYLDEESIRNRRHALGKLDPVTDYIVGLQLEVDGELGGGIWKRFNLKDLATGNEQIIPVTDDATVYAINRQLHVNRDREMKGFVQVSDFSGRVVLTRNLSGTEALMDLPAAGNYIVSVVCSDGVTTRKISVK